MSEPDNDGRLYPQFPVAAAAAVVILDGRVLMIKRANEPNRGKWSIPGGRIELGETVYEAVQREVLEECNIEIGNMRLLNVGDNIIRDAESKVKYHYVLIDFLAEYKAGEIRVAESEVEEYRWVIAEDLPGLDIAPQLRSILMRELSKSKIK